MIFHKNKKGVIIMFAWIINEHGEWEEVFLDDDE